jgi:putative flippase GtrA
MSRRIKKTDLLQFLRFGLVGASNSAIDFGVLNALLFLFPTTSTLATLGYNSIAVLVAAVNSFLWNKYWTFQKPGPITLQEVFRFSIIAGSTALTNDALMFSLGLALPGIMASGLIGANALKLGAIIGTMSISFFGMRLWVFFFQKRLVGGEMWEFADLETMLLPATLSLFYDADTIVVGAIRPGRHRPVRLMPVPREMESSISREQALW